MSVGEL